MSEAAKQKLFTVDEANQLVPILTRLIERLQRHYRNLVAELSAVGLSPDDLEAALAENQESAAIKSCLNEITQCIAEIESHGCHFKGLDVGLVDFPALINNELAYLCWQYGEDQVSFWHGLNDGYVGRHPLTPERPSRMNVN
jgi:hypothetical protein